MTFFNDPPSFDEGNPNLIDATGKRYGNQESMHTIATGSTIASQRTSSRRRAFSYQHTFAERTNGAGGPRWDARREHVAYTHLQYSRAGTCSRRALHSATPACVYARTPQFSRTSNGFGGPTASPSAALGRAGLGCDGPFHADGRCLQRPDHERDRQRQRRLNFADFLLGYRPPIRLAAVRSMTPTSIRPLYVNDIWRLSRRVTTHIRLRWEPNLRRGPERVRRWLES